MIYLTYTGNLFFHSGVENSAMPQSQIINNTTNAFFNLLITINQEQTMLKNKRAIMVTWVRFVSSNVFFDGHSLATILRQ